MHKSPSHKKQFGEAFLTKWHMYVQWLTPWGPGVEEYPPHKCELRYDGTPVLLDTAMFCSVNIWRATLRQWASTEADAEGCLEVSDDRLFAIKT